MKLVNVSRGDGIRHRVRSHCEGESRVEQSHGNACDINTIMARVRKGGSIPTRFREGTYGDFTGYDDFHSCLERVRQARSDFMSIPAAIRSQFDNDPGKMLEFVQNPENLREAVEMGLLGREVLATEESLPGRAEEPESPSEPAVAP